jgi:hypothetical protein
MRRMFLMTAVFFIAMNLWADDPWKAKSFKQWDENDLRRILNDSPWAKPIKRLSLEGKSGGESNDEGDDDEGDTREKKDDNKQQVRFVVRWVSSRTLREAWARGLALHGRISDADVEKSLPPAPEDYEITILGPDMNIFSKANEDTLKAKSRLLSKKSKQQVESSSVKIVRSSDGKKINGVVFHFPKTTPSGEPLFAKDESEIKFIGRGGTEEISVTFNPQKMIDANGPDL